MGVNFLKIVERAKTEGDSRRSDRNGVSNLETCHVSGQNHSHLLGCKDVSQLARTS
jgi:hypothetical protein